MINLTVEIPPDFERKLSSDLQSVMMQDMLTEKSKKMVLNNVVSTVLSHIAKAQGPEFPWSPHGKKTLLARNVKRNVMGMRNVLPPSPDAYLRRETLANIRDKTTIEAGTGPKGVTYSVVFNSNTLNYDVSYPKTGIRVTDLKLAHDRDYRLGGGIATPKFAKALLIPLSSGDANMIAQTEFSKYRAQHPRTKKTTVAESGEGEVFSWRNAGIKTINGALIAFRNKTKTGVVRGGRRPFIYLTTNELNSIARNLFGEREV